MSSHSSMVGQGGDKPESKGPGHTVIMVELRGNRTPWNTEEGVHSARKGAPLQTPRLLGQVCSEHHISSSCHPQNSLRGSRKVGQKPSVLQVSTKPPRGQSAWRWDGYPKPRLPGLLFPSTIVTTQYIPTQDASPGHWLHLARPCG